MRNKAVYLLFCKFTLHVSGCQPHRSSGVHKTVTTASSTLQLHTLQRDQAWPRWRAKKILPVPEAVVTVLCTPDDGVVDTRNMLSELAE